MVLGAHMLIKAQTVARHGGSLVAQEASSPLPLLGCYFSTGKDSDTGFMSFVVPFHGVYFLPITGRIKIMIEMRKAKKKKT